jgi:hypothetical protein
MAQVACRLGLEKGGGKGIRSLVGRLGRLAARRLWPKGRTSQWAAGPTGPKSEEEPFRNKN